MEKSLSPHVQIELGFAWLVLFTIYGYTIIFHPVTGWLMALRIAGFVWLILCFMAYELCLYMGEGTAYLLWRFCRFDFGLLLIVGGPKLLFKAIFLLVGGMIKLDLLRIENANLRLLNWSLLKVSDAGVHIIAALSRAYVFLTSEGTVDPGDLKFESVHGIDPEGSLRTRFALKLQSDDAQVPGWVPKTSNTGPDQVITGDRDGGDTGLERRGEGDRPRKDSQAEGSGDRS